MQQTDVTHVLGQVEAKEPDAFEQLLEKSVSVVEANGEVKAVQPAQGITIKTLDLLHEAYLKLVRYQGVSWKGRAHFFGTVANTMHRILPDHARYKMATKRRGVRGMKRVSSRKSVVLDVISNSLRMPRRSFGRPRGAEVRV